MYSYYNIVALKYGLTKIDFRNNKGHALGHRGGGMKRKYKIINYKYVCYNLRGIILSLVYDSFRSACSALVSYSNGVVCYIISVLGLYPGFIIYSGFNASITLGNSFYLWQIPLGIKISLIELFPNVGSKLVRSAGTFGIVLRKSKKFSVLKLPSGELRLFLNTCIATIGRISNSFSKFQHYGKAGVSRKLGYRPHVRGVAKNPVDHPHGGDTSGGRPSVSPWGKYTKGLVTKNKNKVTNKWIVKYRKGFINKNSLIF